MVGCRRPIGSCRRARVKAALRAPPAARTARSCGEWPLTRSSSARQSSVDAALVNFRLTLAACPHAAPLKRSLQPLSKPLRFCNPPAADPTFSCRAVPAEPGRYHLAVVKLETLSPAPVDKHETPSLMMALITSDRGRKNPLIHVGSGMALYSPRIFVADQDAPAPQVLVDHDGVRATTACPFSFLCLSPRFHGADCAVFSAFRRSPTER